MNRRPHMHERVIIHLAMCDDWFGELVARGLENEWVQLKAYKSGRLIHGGRWD